MDTQSIVILDFGSQYTQLIARRIRELNVFSAVLPCTASIAEIEAYAPIGIILSGGPCSVYDADAPDANPAILALGLPVLGICYGLHFIVHHLGGNRDGRDRFKGHQWYAACAQFCERWDQASFDPDYPTMPLTAFEPLVHKIFSRPAHDPRYTADPAP